MTDEEREGLIERMVVSGAEVSRVEDIATPPYEEWPEGEKRVARDVMRAALAIAEGEIERRIIERIGETAVWPQDTRKKILAEISRRSTDTTR